MGLPEFGEEEEWRRLDSGQRSPAAASQRQLGALAQPQARHARAEATPGRKQDGGAALVAPAGCAGDSPASVGSPGSLDASCSRCSRLVCRVMFYFKRVRASGGVIRVGPCVCEVQRSGRRKTSGSCCRGAQNLSAQSQARMWSKGLSGSGSDALQQRPGRVAKS